MWSAEIKNSDIDSPDEQEVSSMERDRVNGQVETQLTQTDHDMEREKSPDQQEGDDGMNGEEAASAQLEQLDASQSVGSVNENNFPINPRDVVEKKTSETQMSKLRVRDMIKLYNMATEKNQELSQAKSMYFGINKYGTYANRKIKVMETSEGEADSGNLSSAPELIYADDETEKISSERSVCEHKKCKHVVEEESDQLTNEMSTDNLAKSSDCAAGDSEGGTASATNNESPYKLQCEVCRQYTRHNFSHSTSNSGFRIMTSEGKSSLTRTDMNQTGCDAHEKAYESKTTIKKTDNGVRITIDIFFDQEQNLDEIVNSRVETDIPESRIMSEFHQESRARRNYTSQA